MRSGRDYPTLFIQIETFLRFMLEQTLTLSICKSTSQTLRVQLKSNLVFSEGSRSGLFSKTPFSVLENLPVLKYLVVEKRPHPCATSTLLTVNDRLSAVALVFNESLAALHAKLIYERSRSLGDLYR